MRWFGMLILTLGLGLGAAACGAEPLHIAKQGYFYVGGRYVDGPGGQVMDGQMFVQYQIPAKRRGRFPIVFIHGQGQSGLNFLGTPDDRPGWADYFLRRGYSVYVVDQVYRGRSPYHAGLDGPLTPFTPRRIEQLFTAPERDKAWPQAQLHHQFPGGGVRGDADFDQFYAGQLDSSGDDLRMDLVNQAAGTALLDKIGPAILVTHSRAGALGWLMADARPLLVKAIVAAEPWGPPFREVEPERIGGAPAEGLPSLKRPWGLTTAPIHFSPPVQESGELQPVQDAAGDGYRCWRMGGAPRVLPNLQGVPILILTGEASYHRLYDRCTSAFLTQLGVKHTWTQLGEVGLHGNAHMMMIEKNNLAIAAYIQTWLGKALTAPKPLYGRAP